MIICFQWRKEETNDFWERENYLSPILGGEWNFHFSTSREEKNHDFSVIEIFAGVWYGLVLETLATLGNGTTTRSSKDEW